MGFTPTPEVESHPVKNGVRVHISADNNNPTPSTSITTTVIKREEVNRVRVPCLLKANTLVYCHLIQILQPLVKIQDNEAIVLPRETVAKHLKGAIALVLDPTPNLFKFPRRFLRMSYGGSDQHFIAFISPDKNPSSTPANPIRRRMVFPMPEVNPDMPNQPGAPGLILCSIPDLVENSPWSLFRRVQPSPACWEYMGSYKNTVSAKMTGEEFTKQRPEV
jgi:hypothetical protein